jgi:hypothetical protein
MFNEFKHVICGPRSATRSGDGTRAEIQVGIRAPKARSALLASLHRALMNEIVTANAQLRARFVFILIVRASLIASLWLTTANDVKAANITLSGDTNQQ